MATSDETKSSSELLRATQYHGAYLTANPSTETMGAEVQKVRSTLAQAVLARGALDDLRTEKLAIVQARDFELDLGLREMERAVLRTVRQNRDHPTYRAVFPRGLLALIAMRGESEACEVKVAVGQLKAHLPAVAAKHGQKLLDLAYACVVAEQEWRKAETTRATTFVVEVLARGDLVRCMQKSEGALWQLLPGEKRLG